MELPVEEMHDKPGVVRNLASDGSSRKLCQGRKAFGLGLFCFVKVPSLKSKESHDMANGEIDCLKSYHLSRKRSNDSAVGSNLNKW